MARKSFTNDNPALRFITDPEEKTEEPAARPRTPSKPKATPREFKLNPEYIETKTRRVQLIMQPSLYDRVKAAADKEGISVNEYIHAILDDATKAKK